MATINDFKREISELVKAQKVAKRINTNVAENIRC